MSLRYSLIGCLFCCWACNNIEDAKPSERNTFIYFFEAPHNLYGVSAEATDKGYIILGNETLANGDQNSVVIQVDKSGKRIATDVILPGSISTGLKSATDGYYVVGDSIKKNLQSANVADLIIYSAQVVKLGLTGNVMNKVVLADRKDTVKVTDIHGDAVTLTTSGDIIIMLGTFKEVDASEKPYLIALNSTSLDTVWSKEYTIIARDFRNSKSIHIAPAGNIIWASDLLQDVQNFSRSYLTIPYIKENSTFENASQFGQTTEQDISISDITPAASAPFGYAVIGTYSSSTGGNANVFFIRVDQFGNIISGSERYFDGASDKIMVNAGESESEDTGDAITATLDGGFVLAGSMQTTPKRGNGGTDIFLIKVDGQGNLLWNKIIGGSGSESVGSIRETADGNLLICGSNNVSGLSSIFIMKTDKNGELND